jgi:hypothetical protein
MVGRGRMDAASDLEQVKDQVYRRVPRRFDDDSPF